MSKKQVHRPWLLKALMAGRVTNRQAAQALRLSVRQVQRLKGRYQPPSAQGAVGREGTG